VDGAKTADSPTYTEIILNLPGDTVQKHKKSIEDVINLGLGVVRMYQLILLPQTELNTPETRDLYKMKSKFRINPRSFGTYELFGESFVVTEMEEIVVETDTMSFEDYLSCRKLNLSVEIVHNTGFFYELAALFRQLGYSWFSLIETFNSIHSEGAIDEISELYLNYEKENLSGLFDTQEAVRIEMQSNIKKYLEDLDGTNEIAKAKAQAVKNHFSAIHKLVFLIARELLLDQSCTDIPLLSAYLDDLERYSLAKKADFLNIRDVQVEGLRFDFMSFEQDGFDEVRLELESEKSVLLRHDSEQVQLIKSYTSQYDGNTIDGIGRILMRSNPRKLLRKIVSHSNSVETKPADFEGVRVNAYGGFTVE
jgi:DNA-binding protein Fis